MAKPAVGPLDPQNKQQIMEHLHLGEAEAEQMVRQHTLAAELAAKDPSLGITALIIAGDIASAERWQNEADQAAAALAVNTPLDEMPKAIRYLAEPYEDFDPEHPRPNPPATPHERAASLIGSYARLDFAVRNYEAGNIRQNWLFAELPDLWRGSDPDDTDPRFLPLWKAAFAANSSQAIYDNPEQPLPDQPVLTVFRGQDRGAPVGIAFSTDVVIAEKFAHGAALRQSNRHGNTLVATVPRGKVLAYLTRRGEAETIVDPADLTFVSNPVDGKVQR